jgi:hypothetical protein
MSLLLEKEKANCFSRHSHTEHGTKPFCHLACGSSFTTSTSCEFLDSVQGQHYLPGDRVPAHFRLQVPITSSTCHLYSSDQLYTRSSVTPVLGLIGFLGSSQDSEKHLYFSVQSLDLKWPLKGDVIKAWSPACFAVGRWWIF